MPKQDLSPKPSLRLRANPPSPLPQGEGCSFLICRKRACRMRKSASTQSYGRQWESACTRKPICTFAFPQVLGTARLAPGAPLLEPVRDPPLHEAAAGGGSARSCWMHARHGIHTLYELASRRIQAFAKSPSPLNCRPSPVFKDH